PAAAASQRLGPDESDEPASDRRLGITAEEITSSIRHELKLPPDVQGVVITQVSQVSEAWERGLREGDIITEVNRQPVASLAEYRSVVGQLETGEIMALYVVTPNVSVGRFVTLRVGAE
ncbi:MAG TPA: PDZ domain-containing protein, partial [Candidatus Polarisedimenticolia bacterium]|nr:PDZ domain-containing protein [Candidatus Polarisedimenticolia bacterium]